MSRAETCATVLIGRDREVRALTERIDAVSDRAGGALLIRGAAGIGKSSLLEASRAYAAGKRFQILMTTGIQSESHMPFAGLQQLLRPVLQDIDRLPAANRKAICSALGLSDESVPAPFLVAMSILQLLGESSERAPLLLLIDDAQWLDRSTADALAFIARRLESDPVVMVPVMRDGFESPLLEVRLPELRIEALVDTDAASLLDARAPGLSPMLRKRVLGDSAGNPLALIELSVALEAAGENPMRSTEALPLTERLERTFADRLKSLTPGARSFLRIAATDESGLLDELLGAASRLEGRPISIEEAAEAEAAGLVEIDGHHLSFRHPLMRSAIYQVMSLGERQAAHAAVAETLDDDPGRRIWHRAAASNGKDERIAADLEGAAAGALEHGALNVAMEAFYRAAQLTDDPGRRGHRLVRAAYMANGLGRHGDILRLLHEIDDRELRPMDRLEVDLLREVHGIHWSGASRLASFFETADQMRVEGEIDAGIKALCHVALRCWWSNPDEQTRMDMISVAERFALPEDDPNRLYILALVGPVERGSVVVDRLPRLWKEHQGRGESQQLGLAAFAVGDFVHADLLLESFSTQCRAQGWLGALATTLGSQAWTKVHRGDWRTAASMASESVRWAEETGLGNWLTISNLAAATIAAYRGEIDAAEALAATGERVLLPRGASPLLALVQYPRGVAALAAGLHDEAYQHLRRIFDPSDSAYHPHVRTWALVDLVEAALQSGHEAEATGFVRELEKIAAGTRSPLLEVALTFARPVLSPEGGERAFQTGPALLANWPFVRARLQLAHALWLRRQRRPAEARAPLREARDTFDALGAVPWGERARQELRASGETSRRRTYDLSDALSPQELQIAQLAATGLSNKEIGQQLFLSHRTVGSHLYRIFPKLGITARSHLRAALQRDSAQPLR